MLESLSEYLKIKDVKYKENIKLSGLSPIRIGGLGRMIILPRNIAELLDVLHFLERERIKVKSKTVGGMSNLLPDDTGYDGVLIKTDLIREVEISGNEITVGCGASLSRVARCTSEQGLSGFEELSGIPGRVGGAVYMNAGAYGREISELVAECDVYDADSGERVKLTPEQICFSYRESLFSKQNWILLSAKLRLCEVASREIVHRMSVFREKRISSQPTDMPSLGSVFKRPSAEASAGELIDKCGLRGFSLGGAGISEKHAGFIVNLGGATALDVKRLIGLAEHRVNEKFGVHLQKEIEFL
jgi:UDP-N-acetylmuramate dehydrogenase